MNNKKQSISTLLPVLFGFFIMGFCDLVGVSVNYAKDQFGWSETTSSYLPMAVFIWFLILSVPTAMMMDKIGRKMTVLIGMIFTFAGMVVPFIHFDEMCCFIAFALLGIGNTIIQVSLNPLLSNVVSGEKLTSSLTFGQFIKAISSFCGPIVAGTLCMGYLESWVYLFPIYGMITLVATAWLFFTPIQEEKSEKKPSSFGEIFKLLGDPKILLLFGGILCVVGLDVGMNVVSPKLMIERLHVTTQEAGYAPSWYFAARTIGTFCGAFLLAKLSEKIYFRVNVLVCIAAVIALLFTESQLSIISMICLIAFAASSLFSVIYSMAIQARPDKANEISGLMITGVAGGAVFPFLMGIGADATGNQIGSIAVIACCTIYLFICSFSIKTPQ